MSAFEDCCEKIKRINNFEDLIDAVNFENKVKLLSMDGLKEKLNETKLELNLIFSPNSSFNIDKFKKLMHNREILEKEIETRIASDVKESD